METPSLIFTKEMCFGEKGDGKMGEMLHDRPRLAAYTSNPHNTACLPWLRKSEMQAPSNRWYVSLLFLSQCPLYGCANGAAAHIHFLPGAAKARKMTSFLEKVFQGRGGIREKMWGGGAKKGGRKGLCTLQKVSRAGPVLSLCRFSNSGPVFK